MNALEYRCYGRSTPFRDPTAESLKLLTIVQGIEDLGYFANNVKLANLGGNNLKPSQALWILVGGSYAGALVSWAMVG
jgi:hypothetical protein